MAENNAGNGQAEDSFETESGNILQDEEEKENQAGLEVILQETGVFSVTSADDSLVIVACAWQPVLVTHPFWPLSR